MIKTTLRPGLIASAALMAMAGTAQSAIIDAYQDSAAGIGGSQAAVYTVVNGSTVNGTIDSSTVNGVDPILSIFETDGVGGSFDLNLTINNVGSSPFNGWSMAAWDDVTGMPGDGSVTFNGGSLFGTLDVSFGGLVLSGSSAQLSVTVNYGTGTDVIGMAQTSVVPVPAALPLFLSGLFGLGLFNRKKKTA